jgi:glycine cleavage system regulatory protein
MLEKFRIVNLRISLSWDKFSKLKQTLLSMIKVFIIVMICDSYCANGNITKINLSSELGNTFKC